MHRRRLSAGRDRLPGRHQPVEVERAERLAVAPGVVVGQGDVGVVGLVRRDVGRPALGVEPELEGVAAEHEPAALPVEHAVARRVPPGVDQVETPGERRPGPERPRDRQRLGHRELLRLDDDFGPEPVRDAPGAPQHVARARTPRSGRRLGSPSSRARRRRSIRRPPSGPPRARSRQATRPGRSRWPGRPRPSRRRRAPRATASGGPRRRRRPSGTASRPAGAGAGSRCKRGSPAGRQSGAARTRSGRRRTGSGASRCVPCQAGSTWDDGSALAASSSRIVWRSWSRP